MLPVRSQCIAISLITLAGITAFAQRGDEAQVRRMRANGADLAYVEQGRGTPVVFVHGAVLDLRFWEPQRSALAKAHRFVAYTLRYHGTRPWPDQGARYSTETHTADLAAFIEGLGAGPVHLVGLSYGGVLAALVALEKPSLVRTLTLAEPGLFSVLADQPDGQAALDAWMKSIAPVAAATKAGDLELATRHLSAVVTGGSLEDFDTLRADLRQTLLDNARTLPLLLNAAPATVSCEMLRGITPPTLVVHGERTPPFFVKISERVAGCIPGSRMVVIPDASHGMSHDNPADFNRQVLDFVARHRAGS